MKLLSSPTLAVLQVGCISLIAIAGFGCSGSSNSDSNAANLAAVSAFSTADLNGLWSVNDDPVNPVTRSNCTGELASRSFDSFTSFDVQLSQVGASFSGVTTSNCASSSLNFDSGTPVGAAISDFGAASASSCSPAGISVGGVLNGRALNGELTVNQGGSLMRTQFYGSTQGNVAQLVATSFTVDGLNGQCTAAGTLTLTR